MAGGKPANESVPVEREAPASEGGVPRHSEIRELAPGEPAPPSTPIELDPIDREVLESLATSLRHPAGTGAFNAEVLARRLGIRSVELARRVLAALGDGSSSDVEAFLVGVRRLLCGRPDEKRRFAFRIHDLDGDGELDRTELCRMITLGFAEDDVSMRTDDADRLAALVLREADRSRDGRLSFAEFEAAVACYPDVAESIAKSGPRWFLVRDGGGDGVELRPPLARRLVRAFENRAPFYVFVAAWVLANVFFFEHAWRTYSSSPVLVQLARGCGACLNFNGALILLPMMRRFLTAVRKTPLLAFVPLDDAVELHSLAGHAMFGFALVHTAAHLTNYARMPNIHVLKQLASTAPGRTGVAWLVVFGVMWFFARPSARAQRRFEVFHATHALYAVWFLVGILHGPVFWKWVTPPLVAFALERLVRAARRSARTEIVATRVLRSGVTRLDLRKPEGFDHRAGDFVFLKIPQVAEYEWHPFTVSSAPERRTLSVHARALGDWTTALRRLAEARQGLDCAPLPAFVDGPYGAPCTAVFDSRRAVLIAGGIGVTPFASVLESIVLRAGARADVRQGEGEREREGERARTMALQRVDFVWLNRDQNSFEWFVDLLSSVDRLDVRELVRVHVWMTGGHSDAASAVFDLARRAAIAAGDPDLVTGLRIETHMGTPDWPEWLGGIAADAQGERVDVYFCGPPGLARKLAPLCANAGMPFRQERF